MLHLPTKCHLCEDPAVAVFYFSQGCVCDQTTVQPLCLHHCHKACPVSGGSMELIKDLTVDRAFTNHWDLPYREVCERLKNDRN
jgi:hypothetical protein